MELLVVIAIIGILIALLLPAIQAARESARRLQCGNNVKQIGLGIQNFYDAHKVLPTQTMGSAPAASGGCGQGFYSWLAEILPYIEERTLHSSINFKVGMADRCDYPDGSTYDGVTISPTHPNAAAAQKVVSTFLCASDPYEPSTILKLETAPGSYAGNIGWPQGTTGIDGSLKPVQATNGFFGVYNPKSSNGWQKSRVRLSSFPDGLSKTVAVAERLIQSGRTDEDFDQGSNLPKSLNSYCGGSSGSSRSLPAWQTYCGSVKSSDPTYSLPIGRSWISGWSYIGNTYMHVMPIGERSCHIYGGEDVGNNMITPESRHTGGINVAMGDGSVHFVQDTIERRIWWAVGSRNGGEPSGITE